MKHVVIKIGSSTLVKDGKIDAVFMGHLASECANLMHDEGIQPIIVSSGSIALGLEVLGIHGDRPDDMPTLQAAASIGQVGLIRQYTDTFACFGVTVGQILMTRATTGQRESYLHARDTIERLLELGVVPIINENDTVAVEEIRFGDNDTLAAMVATMCKRRPRGAAQRYRWPVYGRSAQKRRCRAAQYREQDERGD